MHLAHTMSQLHEVLEKFLNDDSDMHRLNLSAEELSRQLSLGGPLSRPGRKHRFKSIITRSEEPAADDLPREVEADAIKGEEALATPSVRGDGGGHLFSRLIS